MWPGCTGGVGSTWIVLHWGVFLSPHALVGMAWCLVVLAIFGNQAAWGDLGAGGSTTPVAVLVGTAIWEERGWRRMGGMVLGSLMAGGVHFNPWEVGPGWTIPVCEVISVAAVGIGSGERSWVAVVLLVMRVWHTPAFPGESGGSSANGTVAITVGTGVDRRARRSRSRGAG